MDSSKPIPAPTKSLANIVKNGVAGIRAELIGAAPIHHMFGRAGEDQAESVEVLERRITGKNFSASSEEQRFERGDDVVDLHKKRKGTIIRALKASSEDGQKRFEIVDSKGNSWTQKTSLLRHRH